MRDIILFGIQGSGKGTQASMIVQKMPEAFSYFSTGDLFRSLLSSDNAIGNYLKHRIESGQLIDDKVTNTMFEAYMYTVADDQRHMLLDGYPRSVPQLECILNLCETNNRKPLGIHYVVPDEIVKERMILRARKDDTLQAIQKRIDQFYEKTMPVITYFKEHAELVEINANDTIENIHEHTMAVLAQHS